MEKTIDRTYYRRSARMVENEKEKIIHQKSYQLVAIFLDQMIISLLVVLEIVTTQYYGWNGLTNWISQNFSNGYTTQEVWTLMKNHFSSNSTPLIVVDDSGEAKEKMQSGEIGNESFKSGEVMLAVENYHLIVPVQGNISSHFRKQRARRRN